MLKEASTMLVVRIFAEMKLGWVDKNNEDLRRSGERCCLKCINEWLKDRRRMDGDEEKKREPKDHGRRRGSYTRIRKILAVAVYAGRSWFLVRVWLQEGNCTVGKWPVAYDGKSRAMESAARPIELGKKRCLWCHIEEK